jgi:hypothetical protein
MALPKQPTVKSITEEALKRAGIQVNPDTCRRAKEYWFPEAVNDIINSARAARADGLFEVLHTTATTVTVPNQRRYALPEDYDEGLTVQVIDGTHSGTVSSVPSTTSINIGTTYTSTDINGSYILITSGFGVGQLRQIVSYDNSTGIAVIDINWDEGNQPESTSTYMICDEFYLIDAEWIKESDEIENPVSPRRPRAFSELNNEYIFDYPPDKVYGIRLRYYANPNMIDYDNEKWSKMLRDWLSALVEGVHAIALEDIDDARSDDARARQMSKIAGIIAKERPFGDEFEGFTLERIPGMRRS